MKQKKTLTLSRKQILIEAQCQGAYFNKTQCQGAYAGDEYIDFKDRIGKETELKSMQFAGEFKKAMKI